MKQLPRILQGGMGAGVSNWRLAQAVSRLGQLGVVSSTAIDQIFLRRLGNGDPDGSMRAGLELFPFPQMARRVWQEYFVPGGRVVQQSFRTTPMHTHNDARKLIELCIVSNFVEVALARMGHRNAVGINLLEKVQTVHLPSLYGAMLAGVGYVLMGAGIPLHIPGVLDRFAAHEPAEYRLSVTGAPEPVMMRFDPRSFIGDEWHAAHLPGIERPKFLAIVSSNALAATMLRRANGRVDGLVVETHRAGGHNAPPRGREQRTPSGEPVYGERDQVDFTALRALGVPFWLAGNYGSPERLLDALDLGATGIQVGTPFAFAEESGIDPALKQSVLERVRSGSAQVFTDPLASPTGFPFKVVGLDGTLSAPDAYAARERVCDLGYLREPFWIDESGPAAQSSPASRIGYRCPAEPVAAYVAKGGHASETAGRKCLCNALLAHIGLAQCRSDGRAELPLLTAGDGLNELAQFLPADRPGYTAADVLAHLLGTPAQPALSASES